MALGLESLFAPRLQLWLKLDKEYLVGPNAESPSIEFSVRALLTAKLSDILLPFNIGIKHSIDEVHDWIFRLGEEVLLCYHSALSFSDKESERSFDVDVFDHVKKIFSSIDPMSMFLITLRKSFR